MTIRSDQNQSTALSDFIAKRGATMTIRDALDIAYVIEAAKYSRKVAWLNECRDVMEGEVRCIGDEWGNLLSADDDVRDAYVRITTTMGFEHFMPMHEAIRLHRRDEWMVVDR